MSYFDLAYIDLAYLHDKGDFTFLFKFITIK